MNNPENNPYEQFKPDAHIRNVFSRIGLKELTYFKRGLVVEDVKRQLVENHVLADVIVGSKVRYTYDISRITPYMDFHNNDAEKVMYIAQAMILGLVAMAPDEFSEAALAQNKKEWGCDAEFDTESDDVSVELWIEDIL